jgi:hypothetical protein
MSTQSKIVKPPAKKSLASSMRTLAELERLTGSGSRGTRNVRAIATMAAANNRWQIPAHASFAKYDDRAARLFRVGRAREDGSRSVSAEHSRPATGRGRASGWNPAATMLNVQGQAPLRTRQLSSAMDALSRVEQSVGSNSATEAISVASRNAALISAGTESSSRARESLGAGRSRAGRMGFIANASSIRGVVPLTNVSQRRFAQPVGSVRDPNSGRAPSAISINSSPTVVINATAANSNIQRDVIGALRAHREELFDQLKRESARRERAQF